jgi:hypothetical protein
MDNPIANFFKDLFCSDGGCGYTPSVSSDDNHAKKIADELAEMKEKYDEAASKAEQKIMSYLSSSMKSFVDDLSKINKMKYGDKELNVDIEYITKKNDELSKTVIGHIGNIMHDRLVQTDPELSVILKENDDKKRAKNFKKFCDDVFEDAVKSLRKPIMESIHAQQRVIENEIGQRIKEVTSSSKRTLNELNRIKQQKAKGDKECENEKISCIYRIGVLDCILDELEK